jgi:hypothetical protein
MIAPHDVDGQPTTWHDGSDLTCACGARYERRRWTCCGRSRRRSTVCRPDRRCGWRASVRRPSKADVATARDTASVIALVSRHAKT